MPTQFMTAEEQETTFRRWVRDHLGLILKVVRGSTGRVEDQEDLLQDVLVQVWSSIPRFRGESKETTWIYRVAFNTALAWRRAERRQREGRERYLKLQLLPQAQPGHADSLPEQEVVEQLYRAIRRLPKVDASLALMHLDGLSYQEMAEVAGISENYIGVKLTRIRKQLAEQLKGAYHEL
jgi:RNA polymerase sigma-70 factor (ECF subfamily)